MGPAGLPPASVRRFRRGCGVFVVAVGVLTVGTSGAGDTPWRHGEVLFSESFSDSSGGRFTHDREGVWSVRNGHLHARLPDERQQRSFAFFGSERWRDYAVDLDVCALRGVDKGVAVRVRGKRGLVVDLRGPGYDDVVLHRGYSKLGQARAENAHGYWSHLRVEARGARYRVWVDGRLAIDHADRRNRDPQGRLALVAYTGGQGECEVLYDDVVVRALE
jgi:hypothetical protein